MRLRRSDRAGPAKTLAGLRRTCSGGDRLLVYRNGGAWHELRAEEVNPRFKEIVGERCSVGEHLGNTPAVAKKSYVDPRLVAEPAIRDLSTLDNIRCGVRSPGPTGGIVVGRRDDEYAGHRPPVLVLPTPGASTLRQWRRRGHQGGWFGILCGHDLLTKRFSADSAEVAVLGSDAR